MFFLTPKLDQNDLLPFPPLHKQAEEPSPQDSWSPPLPTSIPLNSEFPQTVPPVVSLTGLHKEFHPSPSLHLPGGRNLLQQIDGSDWFASMRASEADVHYPFASWPEWQLGKWLASAL